MISKLNETKERKPAVVQVITQPTLDQRWDAIKPFAKKLSMEQILPLCWDLFVQMVNNNELTLTKEGIRSFGDIADSMFEFSHGQKQQFSRYFRNKIR